MHSVSFFAHAQHKPWVVPYPTWNALALFNYLVFKLRKCDRWVAIQPCKDKPNALKRDFIYNIDMLFQKKGFQTFIYMYYKSFDIHICSSRTGSFYAFCNNRLK